MNIYIQNKLDAFDKEFPNPLYDDFILGSPEMTESLKAFIKQSITDYHNHIIEKIKNKDGEYTVENRDGTKVEFLEKKLLLSLLQDTNKE